MGDTHESNGQIHMVMGQVYLCQKNFEMALDSMQQALAILEESFGGDSEQVGNCYLELAKVHYRSRKVDLAIQCQSSAHEIFSSIEKYFGSDFMANILVTMAEMQEKNDQLEDALASLIQAREIMIQNYSEHDKRTCKVKRNISLLLLKQGKHQLALDEMRQVEVS
jgi:tetratricopeptide (TPR) repeat protein